MSINIELREKKEKIYRNINKIKNQDFYHEIFNIIEPLNNYSKNNNGIFFDVNLLDEETINKILLIIKKYNHNNDSITEDSITYKPYSDNNYDKSVESLGGIKKLNNFEKNIIKKISNNL